MKKMNDHAMPMGMYSHEGTPRLYMYSGKPKTIWTTTSHAVMRASQNTKIPVSGEPEEGINLVLFMPVGMTVELTSIGSNPAPDSIMEAMFRERRNSIASEVLLTGYQSPFFEIRRI